MSSKANSFPKQEHLCRDKCIAHLFECGSSFITYPLRVVFISERQGEGVKPPAMVLISVSKKRFKRAVDRNRIKRLIREAYRINKQSLWSNLAEKSLRVDIAFQYVANEILDFAVIEKKLKQGVDKIITEINENQKNI